MKIQEAVLNSIIKHSLAELPYESCGYLAKKGEIITKHYELTNTDKAADHFSMDPKEQFAAIKDMRSLGVELCAVYHSHPETPARPSEEDIRLAYDPNVSYVIISLADNECDIKAFNINQGSVEAEKIKIIPEPCKKEI